MIEQSVLICPICGQETKNLISHTRRRHDNSIKSRVEFEEKFPELKGTRLVICNRKPITCTCPECNKVYPGRGYLQLHIKNSHPEKFKHIREYSLPKLTCPICNKEFGTLRQHIKETHNLLWSDFCERYNWDINKSKIVTDEYRKKLSTNKKQYYRSELGIERKKKQSKYWIEHNPMSDPKNIEKSMYTRSSKGHLRVRTQDMRGIKIQFENNTFRSFNEFYFYLLCKRHNLNVIYEPNNYCIKWFKEESGYYSTYLPDFYIDGIGLIELKLTKYDVNKAINEEKYIKVSNLFNQLHIPFRISTVTNFFENIMNIKLSFEDNDYVKNTVLNAYRENSIRIITPYRHSRVLQNIFDTEDLSEVSVIEFTKIKGYNLYGEL